MRSGRPTSGKEISPTQLYSQSAIYVAAAHALKPNYSVLYICTSGLCSCCSISNLKCLCFMTSLLIHAGISQCSTTSQIYGQSL
jgi:hypothetical protein